jgi:general secretion pathway protein D
VSVPTPATGGLTVGALRGVGRNDLLVSPLQATLNMMLQDGDATVLASPRIRSRNKEKAKILVGDKLPIITNLISPQQAGQSSVVTGSIQYVEVGIKLEVEPQIYADGDVGIKLNLEVSNVTDTIQTDSGRAYQIGTRTAQSTLRLHDGETQVMAGLINDSDRNSALKIPGVGQMPVLGRLFSNNTGNTNKSEIVLSITPRIIRPQAMPNLRNADAWSGTETSIRDRQLRIEPLAVLKASTPKADPAAAGARTPAPAPVAPPPAPAGTPSATPTVTPSATPPEAGAAAADGSAPAAAAAGSEAAPAAAAAAAPAAAASAPPGATANGFPIVVPRPLPMRGTTPQSSGASRQ